MQEREEWDNWEISLQIAMVTGRQELQCEPFNLVHWLAVDYILGNIIFRHYAVFDTILYKGREYLQGSWNQSLIDFERRRGTCITQS